MIGWKGFLEKGNDAGQTEYIIEGMQEEPEKNTDYGLCTKFSQLPGVTNE